MNVTVYAEENQLSVEVPRRQKSYTSLADVFEPAVDQVHKLAPKCAPEPAPKSAHTLSENKLLPESISSDEEADRSEGDDDSEGTESSNDEMDSTSYAEENQVSVEVLRRENSYTLLADIFAPLFMRNVEQGAATQCYVAAHPEMQGVSGKYFADCNVARSTRPSSPSSLLV